MTKGMVRSSAVVGALVALMAAGCATGGNSMSAKLSPDEAVATRQRLMKNIGANWADIQAKAKANNVEAIAVNAETIAMAAPHIPGFFPAGSLTAKSNAKPEVWQQWSDFQGDAKNLETKMTALRDAAKAKNAEQVQAMVKDLGRTACGACHTPFRVPPKKQ